MLRQKINQAKAQEASAAAMLQQKKDDPVAKKMQSRRLGRYHDYQLHRPVKQDADGLDNVDDFFDDEQDDFAKEEQHGTSSSSDTMHNNDSGDTHEERENIRDLTNQLSTLTPSGGAKPIARKDGYEDMYEINARANAASSTSSSSRYAGEEQPYDGIAKESRSKVFKSRRELRRSMPAVPLTRSLLHEEEEEHLPTAIVAPAPEMLVQTTTTEIIPTIDDAAAIALVAPTVAAIVAHEAEEAVMQDEPMAADTYWQSGISQTQEPISPTPETQPRPDLLQSTDAPLVEPEVAMEDNATPIPEETVATEEAASTEEVPFVSETQEAPDFDDDMRQPDEEQEAAPAPPLPIDPLPSTTESRAPIDTAFPSGAHFADTAETTAPAFDMDDFNQQDTGADEQDTLEEAHDSIPPPASPPSHHEQEEEEEEERIEPNEQTPKAPTTTKTKKSKATTGGSSSAPAKPRTKRTTLQYAVPTSADDDADEKENQGLRVSRRHRIKPVAYWRMERVNYYRGEIDDVVYVSEDDTSTRKRKAATGTGRSKSAHGAKTKKGSTQAQRRNLKSSSESPPKALTVSEGSVLDRDKQEVHRRLAVTEEMADFLKQDVQGRPEFTVAKTFSEGNDFCAGLLHLPPGAMKPGRNSGSYCFHYTVKRGSVRFKIHTTTFQLPEGSDILVPRHNYYEIENCGREEAKLSFSMARGASMTPSHTNVPSAEQQRHRQALESS